MFNDLITKVSYVLQNTLYKCKLSGSIVANVGTARQTLLAYSRSTGELLGSTVWDEETQTYELFLATQPDEGVMLTRRDEGGVYFAETYDRLSLCTVTNTPNSFHDSLMDRENYRVMIARKPSLFYYPFNTQFENLKKVDGVFSFQSDYSGFNLIVDNNSYPLPKKVRGCVYADNDVLIYDGNSDSFPKTGFISPAESIDPFGDGSLIASYPMSTDGVDCTGNYNTIDFNPNRFNLGGYNTFYGSTCPFTVPIVITRAATRTIVFNFSFYNYNAIHYELFRIPGLLYVTLYNNIIYLWNINAATWSSVVAYTISVNMYARHQVAITISQSGFDKVFVDCSVRNTKAIGTPTVPNTEYLSFNGLRLISTHEVVINNLMIFNRELTSMELIRLWEETKFPAQRSAPSTYNAMVSNDSSITLSGNNLLSDLKARFPLDGNIGNIYGSTNGFVSVGGVSLYKEYIKFNGTSGCINKSPIYAWWNPDDVNSVTIATGISKLLDKSGNGNNLVQATPAAQPSRQTNIINGRSVMRFDGTDDQIATAVKLPYQAVSIFHVQKTTDATYTIYNDNTFWILGATTGNNSTGASSYNAYMYGKAGGLSINGNPVNNYLTRNELYTALHNINAVVSSLDNDLRYFTAFKISGVSTFFWAADMGEIIIVPAFQPNSVVQGIEGYLAHRWGTTATLPASHPYKSVAPTGTLEEIVAGTDRFNPLTQDISIRFSPTAVTAQCIWKKGSDIEGIAIGIDSTAHVTLYARNSNVLTSSSFTATVSSGVWYRVMIKGADMVLLDDENTVIETKAHGLTFDNYTGSESLGAAFGGSPILGTSGTSGFFNGLVSELLITDTGTTEQKVIDSENTISVWNGDVELPVEIVKWDMENNEAIIWTSTDILPGEDTVLSVLQSTLPTKSGVVGSSNAQKVWDDNFVAVYHMMPSSKLIDSTANHYDGLFYGIDNSNFISDDTGWSLNFNGTDEYAKVIYPVLSDSQRMSVSTVLKADTIADNVRVLDLALSDAQDSSQQFSMQFDASDQLTASLYDTSHTLIGDVTSGVLGTVDESLITVNYDGKANAGSMEMFVDSTSVDTTTPSGKRVAYNTGALHIGKDAYAGTYFDGKISELMISDKHRSADFDKIMRLGVTDQLGTYVPVASEGQLTFNVTIPSERIDADLTDFPLPINFAPVPELVYPVEYSVLTVKSTDYSGTHYPHQATDPSRPLIGTWTGNMWIEESGNTTAKFNIDYDTPKIATRMYLENLHTSGTECCGIKDFTVYGTNSATAFDNTTYADTTDLTELGTFTARAHVPVNISDPQYFYFENTTAYRYYILRVHNRIISGSFNFLGARRISFLATDEVDVRSELFNACDDPTKLIFKFVNTSLSAEIEEWDDVNKKCLFHVKVPIVSSSANTTVSVTVGTEANPLVGISGSAAAMGVWDSNFVAVYHMNQSPVGDILNSKEDLYNMTPFGVMGDDDLVNIDGLPGQSIDFDGTDEYLSNAESISLTSFTYEFVGSLRNLVKQYPALVHFGTSGLAVSQTLDKFYVVYNNNAIVSTSLFTLNSPHYIVGTRDSGGTCSIFYDGLNRNAVSDSNPAWGFSGNKIGDGYTTSVINGVVGEVRVSNIVRSDAWIKATSDGLFFNLNSHEVSVGISKSFKVTVPASNVTADVTNFPLMINFVPVPELVYPSVFDTNTVKATSYLNSIYYHWFAVNPANTVIGTSGGSVCWFSAYGNGTSQKFNIDYGTPVIGTRILLENFHSSGIDTGRGIKDFTVYGTNSVTSFENTTYADETDLTELGTFTAREHVSFDISDPQYFYLENVTAYRYYVIKIANSISDANYMGIRRISILATDEVDVRPVLFNVCDDPIKLVFKVGNAVLPTEIEQWDDVNKKCIFHVKVPTVSSTADTEINVTVGSSANPLSGIVGSVAGQGVWDNYLTVMHMGSLTPSVGDMVFTNGGTAVTFEENGLGTYTKFLGVDSYLSSGFTFPANVTFEVFWNQISTEASSGIFSVGDNPTDGYPRTLLSANSAEGLRNYAITGAYTASLRTLAAGQDNYFSSTINASYSEISYVDGVNLNTRTISDEGDIGTVYLGSGFNGYANIGVYEFRISNVVRPPAYITLTNKSLRGELNLHELTDAEAGAETIVPIVAEITNFTDMTLSEDNATAVLATIAGWDTATCTPTIPNDVPSYWEVKMGPIGGTTNYLVGITSQILTAGQVIGQFITGYGFYANGPVKYNNNVTTGYGLTWGAGDIIGVYFDPINLKLYFSKNGIWLNSADLVAGTGFAFGVTAGTYYAGISIMDTLTYMSVRLYEHELTYPDTVPSGTQLGLGVKPYAGEVTLLVQSKDTDSGTDLTDNSIYGQTVANTLVTHSTIRSKFGTSSLQFLAASSRRFTVALSEYIDFGINDFTIDFWFSRDSDGTRAFLLTSWNSSNLAIRVEIFSNNLVFQSFSDQVTCTYAIGNDTNWHHCEIARKGSQMYLFYDGIMVSTAACIAGANLNQISGLEFGALNGTIYPFNGYMEEIRVVKGAALHTTNFSVPTAPYDLTEPVTDPGAITFADFQFIIPSGTVTGIEKNVPIMMKLSDSSGISNFDMTSIFTKIKEGYLKWTGTNPRKIEFGSTKDGIFDYNLPLVYSAKGPRYEKKGSMWFNGTVASIIDVSNNISRSLLAGNVTVSLWVNPEFLTTSTTVLFGTAAEFYISITGTSGRIIVGHTSTSPTASSSVLANRWNHIIVRRDVVNKTITVMHDNLLVYGPTAYATQPSISAVAINIGGNASYALTGRMSDIRVYNRILTDNECYDLYRSSDFSVYKGNIVTSLLKQPVPLLLGETLDSIEVTDNTEASIDTTFYTYFNGVSASNQFGFNTAPNADITGWVTDTPLSFTYGQGSIVATDNYVYLVGGRENSTQQPYIWVAPIDSNGVIGTFTRYGIDWPVTTSLILNPVIIKNKIYTFGGCNPYGGFINSIFMAPINSDGTIGAFTLVGNMPVSHSYYVSVLNNYVYAIDATTGAIYQMQVNQDGTLYNIVPTGVTVGSYPVPRTIGDKLYFFSIYGTTVTYFTIDEFGTLSSPVASQSFPDQSDNCIIAISNNAVWRIGGTLTTTYRALINSDGTLGSWVSGTALPTSHVGSQCVITSNRIYMIGGGNGQYIGNLVRYAPLVGGTNEYISGNYSVTGGIFASVPVYTYINARPWEQQYGKNSLQIGDITGWTSSGTLPVRQTYISPVVTKNYVYFFPGYMQEGAGQGLGYIHRAPINSDGTIGSFTLETNRFPDLTYVLGSSVIQTRNYVYVLAYQGGSSTNRNWIYRAPINSDGTIGLFVLDSVSLATATGYACVVIYNSTVFVIGGSGPINTVQRAHINQDGTLGSFQNIANFPVAVQGASSCIIGNRIYVTGGLSPNTSTLNLVTYVGVIDENLDITWSNSNNNLSGGVVYCPQIFTTNTRAYLFGGYVISNNTATNNVRIAPINPDGTLGTWTDGTPMLAARWGHGVFVTSSKIYIIGGSLSQFNNTTDNIYSANFLGGKNDYTEDSYSMYIPPFIITKSAWYSLSYDGITYKVKSGDWKNIATSDPAVHGHTGDSVPYYWDADSEEWVYANDSIQGAISKALYYHGNRMDKTVLNNNSDFSLFSPLVGKLEMAISLYSDGSSKPEVTDIKINNKNVWVSEELVLSEFCSTVTSSSVEYTFKLPDDTLDYLEATKIYCLVTGGTQWVECADGTIPNIPTGLTTAGKSAWFKVVWDLDVWVDPADIAIEVKIK